MKKTAAHILLSPRITEKASMLSQAGVYVFNVAPGANKTQVVDAIREVYKVTPRKITIARIPGKATTTRGTNRRGMSASGKKAYVYLRQGDTIELA